MSLLVAIVQLCLKLCSHFHCSYSLEKSLACAETVSPTKPSTVPHISRRHDSWNLLHAYWHWRRLVQNTGGNRNLRG